ncbi:unnamed protein product [Plutella xylostella]|uniref:(diamondback moth) hypothetical protein n=1 Tax=Plutella xylostella TaxID=51655 RepID=A0A8S4G8W2_PLUXY|nr:unnamed protein product [Plutella xylostella]
MHLVDLGPWNKDSKKLTLNQIFFSDRDVTVECVTFSPDKIKRKKPKLKPELNLSEEPLPVSVTNVSEEIASHSCLNENNATLIEESSQKTQNTDHEDSAEDGKQHATVEEQVAPHESTEHIEIKTELVENESSLTTISNQKDDTISYASLNAQLEQINISKETESSSITNVECDSCLEATNTAIGEVSQDSEATDQIETIEDACPSAPVIDEAPVVQELPQVEERSHVKSWENRPKLQSMPLEEAIRVYGGAEINEVRAMSEREEAIVEAGPLSGPEHPLVDLLSTFRCSLNAVERERIELERGFAEEEKTRTRLWKVEKRVVTVSEKCPCGSDVDLRATYEHAELMKGMMPVAKMKLESLLRDAQHSYCHHQHAALLAHCANERGIAGNELAATDCAGFAGRWRERGVRAGEGEDAGRGLRSRAAQENGAAAWDANRFRRAICFRGKTIEELISETTQSSKSCIREALALILKELRVSDSHASALCGALKRWAEALSVALLDRRDLRQLLFLIHQLARQTRSVRWAGRLIEMSAADSVEVARVIAVLDLIMSGTSSVEAAAECTEEADEAWEEVDKKGCGTAVWDGALRERDLLALLRAIPSRDVIATLALFRCRDITKALEYEWGDGSGGRGVLKAACGTRVLTAAVERAVQTHAHYDRLTRELVKLPVGAVSGLADLHLHCRSAYAPSLAAQITAELEETFASVFRLLCDCGAALDQLPFRMLEDHAAMVYCIGFMDMLHESSPRPLDGVAVVLPSSVSCASRVRLVTRACVERDTDVNLAHAVLGFLMQRRKTRRRTSKATALALSHFLPVIATKLFHSSSAAVKKEYPRKFGHSEPDTSPLEVGSRRMPITTRAAAVDAAAAEAAGAADAAVAAVAEAAADAAGPAAAGAAAASVSATPTETSSAAVKKVGAEALGYTT